jgi:hypothetical protein
MPISPAYTAIYEWTEIARSHASTDDLPQLEPLVNSLSGDFFIDPIVARVRDKEGRRLIAFTTDPPEGFVRPGMRYMLPVHAAITRTLELAGADIRLDRPPDKGKDRFHVKLSLRGVPTTTLTRVLFDSPRVPRLYEKSTEDYHYIIPQTFELRWGPIRDHVVTVVGWRSPELATLLSDLFGLADDWHGSELRRTSYEPRPPTAKLHQAARALAVLSNRYGEGRSIPNDVTLDLIERHPKLRDCVLLIMDVDANRRISVQPPLVTALYYSAKYLMNKAAEADQLYEIICRHRPLYSGNPIWQWYRHAQDHNRGQKRLTEAQRVRGIIWAWNSFAKHEVVKGRPFRVPNRLEPLEGLPPGAIFGSTTEARVGGRR